MAKKKAVKKTTAKKKSTKAGKKSVVKKKRPAKKTAAKKSVKKASRVKRPAKKTPRAKAAKKQAVTRASKSPSKKKKRSSAAPALKPRQYLEKMSVTIEGPDKSGDLVATESLGGAALVHHTVHPGAETTAIPGRSYGDLQKLGEGAHEIDVVRTLPPAAGAPPVGSP